jgi:hypothetical protein
MIPPGPMNYPHGTLNPPLGLAAKATIAGVCLLLLAGCGSGDPLDHKVDSGNQMEFSMWEAKVEGNLTPEQVADLKASLQEYRFHIMADGTAHGSEAIEAALMDSINGKTLRAVILQGLGWELDRSEAERATLEDSLKKNAQMYTRPGDTASANYLSDLHERQVARLNAAAEEVKKTRDRIAAETAPAPK